MQHFPERDCSSVVVCSQDRPGLFASITGVFTALNFDILNARIFTANDGRILDVFRISHHGRPEVVMAEQKWVKFRAVLDGVLDGKIDISHLVGSFKRFVAVSETGAESPPQSISTTRLRTVLPSSRFLPRTGSAFFSPSPTACTGGLSIHVAKISTNVDQVADVFMSPITPAGKSTSRSRSKRVRKFLHQNLAPQNDTSERFA